MPKLTLVGLKRYRVPITTYCSGCGIDTDDECPPTCPRLITLERMFPEGAPDERCKTCNETIVKVKVMFLGRTTFTSYCVGCRYGIKGDQAIAEFLSRVPIQQT